MLLYIWLLLTIPQDRLICTLWVNDIPSQAAVIQSCGTDALGAYRLDVLKNGVGICSIPAASLAWVREDCILEGRLDGYMLRIVEPDYQGLIGCSVTTPTPVQPSEQVVREQCPNSKPYQLRLGGTRLVTPQVDTICKPPSIEQPATIATSKEFHLLAGKLIWYGYARANCPGGYSGVDPITFAATPCGMDGARAEMIAWQNSMDADIIAAAKLWNVPAVTLKTMIENETQFWSWTNGPQEHGMIQATDYAAYVVLHVYEKGYYAVTPAQQASARAAWLRQLDCDYCTPKQSIEHAKRMMGAYAQTLAAYYCMYGSWSEALRVWNIKYKEN
jgi:hypothetical protein